MSSWRAWIVAICACGGHPRSERVAPLSNTRIEAIPEVEFVVTDQDGESETPSTRVRFAKTTPAGVVVTRTTAVPGIVRSLAWLGPDPVVMLDEGAVGRITAAGFAPLPTVPTEKWEIPKPAGGDPYTPTDRFDAPRWRLLVGTDGTISQARCDWGWDLPHGIAHHCVPEGGRCDAWVFAQLWPDPVAVSQHEPAIAFDSDAPPALDPVPEAQPATTIRAEIVHVPIPDDPTTERSVLRCTESGATTQYPTDEDRDLRDNNGDGVGELTWLSTAPPMFAVTRRVGCLETMSVIFEGCKQSETFAGARVGGGPHDLLVLWQVGDKLRLRWHDRDVGTLDRVSLLAFAPR